MCLLSQTTTGKTLLGLVALMSGDTTTAEKKLRKAVKLKPNQPEAFRALGTLLAQKGDLKGVCVLLLLLLLFLLLLFLFCLCFCGGEYETRSALLVLSVSVYYWLYLACVWVYLFVCILSTTNHYVMVKCGLAV